MNRKNWRAIIQRCDLTRLQCGYPDIECKNCPIYKQILG